MAKNSTAEVAAAVDGISPYLSGEFVFETQYAVTIGSTSSNLF